MDTSHFFFHSGEKNYFLQHKNLIKLDMTENDYREAIESACYGEYSENYQNLIHEYSHWVQSVGTPFGYYLELVHHFENKLLMELEEYISYRLYSLNGVNVSPPFEQYITDPLFYQIQDESLWDKFGQWLDLFYFTEFGIRRRDLYYGHVTESEQILLQFSKCENTRKVDNFMFPPLLFDRVDNFIDQRLSLFVGREFTPHNTERNSIYSRKNLQCAVATGNNAISEYITQESLWESYATVIEYIETPDDFVFPGKEDGKKCEQNFDKYYDPLSFLEVYLFSATWDKKLFLETCSCLFDIIFSPPILPQCAPLRESKISMFDFDIVSRFYAVAQAAHHINRLNCFDSRGKYIETICSVLGWHTPDEIYFQIRRCWDSLTLIPAGKSFQHFINLRIAGEHLHFNRQRFLAELALDNVKPCFLVFRDKVATNETFDYDLTMDAANYLSCFNYCVGLDNVRPEPMPDENMYYKHYFLQQLVEKIWSGTGKLVVFSKPANCKNPKPILDYLKKWVSKNHIDIQIKLQ